MSAGGQVLKQHVQDSTAQGRTAPPKKCQWLPLLCMIKTERRKGGREEKGRTDGQTRVATWAGGRPAASLIISVPAAQEGADSPQETKTILSPKFLFWMRKLRISPRPLGPPTQVTLRPRAAETQQNDMLPSRARANISRNR